MCFQNFETAWKYYFNQDGNPPHFSILLGLYLDQKYPNRWIGRAGFILCPPLSPDLTNCNYLLCGYLQDIVYCKPLSTI